MNNYEKYLIFLPVCIFVKGHKRSVILDVQRSILDFIPNDLYDIYRKHNKSKVKDILFQYNQVDHEIIKEYIYFLVENEYAVLGTEHDAESISEISLDFCYIGKITNCICEYSEFIHRNIANILTIIDDKLACSALQVIFTTKIDVEALNDFLQSFKNIIFINHLEIVLPYSREYDKVNLDLILSRNLIINKIFFYSSPFNNIEDMGHTYVLHLQEEFTNNTCGLISREYFSQNISHITEALQYNTCLNRKLFINKNGNIKNCPYSEMEYGNILQRNIEKTIASSSFREKWNIKKDDIDICKDCEFRYICTDCRVFIKNKADNYSQPSNCKYNPYIAKWENELGYISVEDYLMSNL